MSEKNTKTIKQSYEIAASREQVFNALTNAGGLSAWWTTRSTSDARAGGAFEYVWEFEDASRNGRQRGAYLEVVPQEIVSFPWEAGDNGGEHNTTVKMTLSEAGDGTMLELDHSGYPRGNGWDEIYEGTAQAWGFFLGNLKSFLEEGQDNRGAVLGQKTR